MTNQTDLISEVRAALQAATPGPWSQEEIYTGYMVTQKETFEVICSAKLHEKKEKNIHLIANAPTWLQQLTDRLEEVVKALEFYEDEQNWKLPAFGMGHSKVTTDHGEFARTTLKRIKGENG